MALQGQGGGLSLMNGAKKIARRHAIPDQPKIDAGILKLYRDRIVGDARR